jgi:hypothetical protein
MSYYYYGFTQQFTGVEGQLIEIYQPTLPSIDMSDETTRVKTFLAWPKGLKVNLIKFIEAGLFYTGIRDLTRCFSCGWENSDWDIDDDPVRRHVSAVPNCQHNLTLDPNIINEILNEETPKLDSSYDLPLCVVCCSNQREVVFMPCGHVATCGICCIQIKNCTHCRNVVKSQIKIYFP